MARENQLIERVHRRFPTSTGGLRVGIGDDAAVLHLRRGVEWVITTDAFLENVHFLRKAHPPDSAGYKALARATSDVAAMGARGRYFFLTLGLPAECTGKWLDAFLSGMARAARRFGLVLAGGDTTRYPLVVSSLTVLGEVDSGKAILRSGARPGDLICVSGRLGEAELGLRLVQTGAGSAGSGLYLQPGQGWSPQNRRLHKHRRWAKLEKKHLHPEPRLALGEWLAGNRLATSMIDISDGLSTDLGHICRASRVGARIWTQKIPTVRIPPGLPLRGLNPLEMALHGGEDYELLFTVPKKLGDRLPKKLRGVPLTVIGEITRSREVVVVDERGRIKPFQPQGWDPFRNRVG